MSDEKLLVEKQKEIIDKIVNHFSTLGTDLYYQSTINICHEIHDTIHKKQFLNIHEKEIVSNLEPKDIQTLLSYNSSCC